MDDDSTLNDEMPEDVVEDQDDETSEVVLSQGVKQADITDTLGKAFLDYAMSVIVARALPDVRDGLKPVHRRILYASHVKGYTHRNKVVKAAKPVADTMGDYHPHGDSAIYETMVRMTQAWWMMHPLIEAQGNWGSRDGDGAAAYRYTECRLAPITEHLLSDLEKDTVDMRDNYSATLKEPKVLPARFPNLLVNGGLGIAVAMASNIPPHNLGEVIEACLMLMANPDATLDDILTVLPGPDFPTKGTILGLGGIRQAYETGQGSIRMMGKFDVVQHKSGKSTIVISELPYGVNAKSTIIKIAALASKKDGQGKAEFEGMASVEDESDEKDPIQIVVELKKDVDPFVALNFLKKKTDIVCNFSYNSVVLNPQGMPERMGLMQMLREFVKFRRQVVRRRTIFDLNAARTELFKQLGLYAAVSIIDEVVAILRKSADPDAALVALINLDMPIDADFRVLLDEADPDEVYGESLRLTEGQAKAILALRLSTLTSLEINKIANVVRELSGFIRGCIAILNDIEVLNGVIRMEFEGLRKFIKPRQSKIDSIDYDEIDEEDLIERTDVIITVSKSGYVKRTPIDAFREQKRGGKGRNGMETKDDDYVHTTLKCTTKTPLAVFTTSGKAYQIKAYKLPEGAPSSKGRPLVNFVPLDKNETVSAIIAMPETEEELEGKSLIFVTSFGYVRRNDVKDFWNIKANGKIAIDLKDELGNPRGDLVSVLLTANDRDILIATEQGFCCRSPVDDLRVFNSRKSVGVKGINLGYGNRVIGASELNHVEFTSQDRDAYQAGGTLVTKDVETGNETVTVLTPERMAEMKESEEMLLTISALGFGKRSSAHEYRVTARGGKGVMAANINAQTGNLVACFPVRDDDGLILTTDGGQTIRTRVGEMRLSSRMTKGVRAFKLPAGQKIVGVERVGGDDVPETPDDLTAETAEG